MNRRQKFIAALIVILGCLAILYSISVVAEVPKRELLIVAQPDSTYIMHVDNKEIVIQNEDDADYLCEVFIRLGYNTNWK